LVGAVLENMGGLNQRRFAERTNGASMPVSAQDVLAEALLMKPETNLGQCVPTHVGSGNDPISSDVGLR
jgi:hypothetical protein